MIRGRIKNVMIALARLYSAQLIRSDQDGDRPAPPFLQYKIISEGRESNQQEIETREDDLTDTTKVLVTIRRKYRPLVSLTFVGVDYDTTWDLADSVKEYLSSDEGKDVCESCGVYPENPTDITDRAAFLETENESRLGFDITFKANVTIERRVDAIDMETLLASLTAQAKP